MTVTRAILKHWIKPSRVEGFREAGGSLPLSDWMLKRARCFWEPFAGLSRSPILIQPHE